MPVLFTLLAFYWRKRYGINLLAHPRTVVRNIQNLITKAGVLSVGVDSFGFLTGDAGCLDIKGKLVTEGNVSLGPGCYLHIGPLATMVMGEHSYVTATSHFIINHGLVIGRDVAISWGCQFLDDDFHTLTYEGQVPKSDKSIIIGDHVWIGSRVSVLSGAIIPTGCVVASGSVITKAFCETNALLAGNPAKIIRHNVEWA